jgi:hypothetical protein
MLNESLEKLSKIGSPKSISFVANWLSKNVTSVETLMQYASSTSGIKASEINPILILFESMELIKIVDDSYIDGASILKEKYLKSEESFKEWFVEKFIDFALDNSIINIDTISYSINDNAYIMSATTIKPKQHACYRNILADYSVIELLNDARYLVNNELEKAIKIPKRHRKISEKQLLHNLQIQRKLGEKGEMFVLEYEKKRISNPTLQDMIQRISIIDVSAGFDIVSFESNDSSKLDRFIEVKTYNGSEHFYWSQNEIDKARLMGDSYYLYLVDDDCIEKEDFEPTIIKNPAKVVLNSLEWMQRPESFEIERLINTDKSSLNQSPVVGYKEFYHEPAYLDAGDAGTYNGIIIDEFLNEAKKMDAATLNSMEKIVSRVNDNHHGIYKQQLDKIRKVADERLATRSIIVNNTTISNFNNNGVFNDHSIESKDNNILE